MMILDNRTLAQLRSRTDRATEYPKRESESVMKIQDWGVIQYFPMSRRL